jgi:hypothetical protein
MRIQQGPNQRRGSVESRIQNQIWILRTTGNVLWHVQLTQYLPRNDERHLQDCHCVLGS